jgi:hypothetical protein
MREKGLFATALADTATTDVEGLGASRVEFDPILGVRRFRWVRNASGGSLAVNSLVGWEPQDTTARTASANTDVTLIIHAGSSTADMVGYYVRVLDDAGGAGAAPEGEVRKIIASTATQLTVSPGFSAAVTTSDTFEIFRPWHIIAAADAMVATEVAGVLMATVANGSYGWVQTHGINLNALVVAAGTTLAAGAALKAGAGILVAAADAADNGEVVGHNVLQVTTDTVLRTALVILSCGPAY